MFSRVVVALLTVAAARSASSQAVVGQAAQHSALIFIAEGLPSRVADEATAPNLSALARQGGSLVNGHSLFATFTMANASAIAIGHYLGDTGVFSNTRYVAHPVPNAAGSLVAFIENAAVLDDLDGHFAGNSN